VSVPKGVCSVTILVLLISSCAVTPKARPFTVDVKSVSCKAGAVEAYFNKEFPMQGLQKSDVTVSYFPDDDAVCLQFKSALVNCNQFWSKTGREAFIAAFERFKYDYEQKKLVKQSGKTRGIYGFIQGYFTWRTLGISKLADDSPKIWLGYYLKDNAAFFATTQKEVNYKVQNENRMLTNPVTIMYFTRAQAEALIALFDQEYLKGLERPEMTDEGRTVWKSIENFFKF